MDSLRVAAGTVTKDLEFWKKKLAERESKEDDERGRHMRALAALERKAKQARGMMARTNEAKTKLRDRIKDVMSQDIDKAADAFF